MMRNQVDHMQLLTSDDFPAAVLRHRLADKAAMEESIEQVPAANR